MYTYIGKIDIKQKVWKAAETSTFTKIQLDQDTNCSHSVDHTISGN